MFTFNYSQHFQELIVRLHRGAEDWPNYQRYLEAHLGGLKSRFFEFTKYLCPEIEYYCGSLKSKRILDYGCGTGATTAALACYCDNICAFDIDEECVEICKQRIREHGFEKKVQFLCANSIDNAKDSIGAFDFILVNGVIEHIPITKVGLRRKTIRGIFELLETLGYLFINETPNRLWPIDFHSTQLWWIPWTKAGSNWAYRRAINQERHSEVPRISKGSLGLEEVGAWGATYWEIKSYLRDKRFVCLNITKGYNRHINYMRFAVSKKMKIYEFITYHLAVKLFQVPITAFFPYIQNLVFKKC